MKHSPVILQGIVFAGILFAPQAWAQFSGHEALLKYQESFKKSADPDSWFRPKAGERGIVDRLLTLPGDRLDGADREFLQALRQKPLWAGWERRAVVEIAREHPELSSTEGFLSGR